MSIQSKMEALITERDATNAIIKTMHQINERRLLQNVQLAYTPEHFVTHTTKLLDIAEELRKLSD